MPHNTTKIYPTTKRLGKGSFGKVFFSNATIIDGQQRTERKANLIICNTELSDQAILGQFANQRKPKISCIVTPTRMLHLDRQTPYSPQGELTEIKKMTVDEFNNIKTTYSFNQGADQNHIIISYENFKNKKYYNQFMQSSPNKNIKQRVIKEFNTVTALPTNDTEIDAEVNNLQILYPNCNIKKIAKNKIKMPRFPGDTLDKIIKEGLLTVSDKISITFALLTITKNLHDLGYVHKDIKPENIMVHKRQDGTWQAAYIDTGMMVEKNRCISSAGTRYYMAPELFQKAAPQQIKATPAADIYALGITLKEFWQAEIDNNSLPENFKSFLKTFRKQTPDERPTAETALTTFSQTYKPMLEQWVKTNQQMQIATGLLITGVVAAVGISVAVTVLTMGTSLAAALIISSMILLGGIISGGIYKGFRRTRQG